MNIKKINLIILALCISSVYNAAYKPTRVLIPKINTPKTLSKAFKPYKSALPLSAIQINNLLLKQTPQVQNKIQNHPFFKEFIIEVPNIEFTDQTSIKFNEKTLLKLEIFMYCMNHPQEAEEIMNFYQEMKDADHLIKDRLELLPAHAQEFFKQQLEKNIIISESENYDPSIHPIKAKILRLYPRVITAFSLTFFFIVLTIFFLDETYFYIGNSNDNIEFDLKNSQDKHLVEVISILLDALDLKDIKLMKGSPDMPHQVAAFFMWTTFGRILTLNPSFFSYSLDVQIFLLLHELRHHKQFHTGTLISIPEDVIEYAKKFGLADPVYAENILYQFFPIKEGERLILFNEQAVPLSEFDADLFAARQMKDYPWMNKVANKYKRNRKNFLPKEGYLTSEMVLKEASDKNQGFLSNFEYKWNSFINKLSNDNLYLMYIPEHLKEAAAKNRALREEKKQ